MPWHKERGHSKCGSGQIAVVKDDDGDVEGCHDTEADANAQIAALHANEEDMTMGENDGTNPTDSITVTTSYGQLVLSPPPALGTAAVAAAMSRNENLAVVTIDTGTTEDAPAAEPSRWEGVLALEGVPTDDNAAMRRIIAPEALEWRELPLPLMAMTEETGEGGHDGHAVCGRIDEIWRIERPDLGERVFAIMGRGEFDSGEFGQEIARLVGERTLRGVSIDPVRVVWSLAKADPFELVEEAAVTADDVLDGAIYAAMTSAAIGAATICPMQALEGATIEILVASATEIDVLNGIGIWLIDDEPLVACAAGPIDPPAAWFKKPSLRQLTPVTVTPEGRVFGHVATRDCHVGAEDRCMRYTPLTDGGAHFHTGSLVTREGSTVSVGRMQVKPHAPRRMSFDDTVAYYSDAKTVAAFVRIYEDDFGIVCAGATRSDAPAELLRDFYANPPSIEQRRGKTLGISCVPLPGLPVVSPEAYLVASGHGVEVEVLRLPPVTPDTVAEWEAEEGMTEDDVLIAAAVLQGPEALAELIAESTYLDDFRTFTADERKRMAENGQAMSDGSFPIANCSDADNAIRAQGRAPEGRRAAVRAHIRKRVRSLSCSGDIFDDYK